MEELKKVVIRAKLQFGDNINSGFEIYTTICLGITAAKNYLVEKTEAFLVMIINTKKAGHFKEELLENLTAKNLGFHRNIKYWSDIRLKVNEGAEMFVRVKLTEAVCQGIKACGIKGEPTDPNKTVTGKNDLY